MDRNGSIGEVVGIYIKKDKDKPWKAIHGGYFEANFGLIGNIHSGKGNRQVSILTEQARKKLESLKFKGICTQRFYENIRIRGLDLGKLKVSSRIIIGESIQEVTEIGKLCFPECNIIRKNKVCPLIEGVLFTKVEKGGKIAVGDPVNID
ncbi:MAG TPA: MOSC domain-containing protein [Tepidimicrobium sp.]|nr:MOSC domain-containing protein [Tepidimicrobium sp.]